MHHMYGFPNANCFCRKRIFNGLVTKACAMHGIVETAFAINDYEVGQTKDDCTKFCTKSLYFECKLILCNETMSNMLHVVYEFPSTQFPKHCTQSSPIRRFSLVLHVCFIKVKDWLVCAFPPSL